MFSFVFPPHDPNRFHSADGYEDDTRTNGMRAAEAESRVSGDLRYADDFSDLITNLLHLAHSRGLDIAAIIRDAIRDIGEEAGPC